MARTWAFHASRVSARKSRSCFSTHIASPLPPKYERASQAKDPAAEPGRAAPAAAPARGLPSLHSGLRLCRRALERSVRRVCVSPAVCCLGAAGAAAGAAAAAGAGGATSSPAPPPPPPTSAGAATAQVPPGRGVPHLPHAIQRPGLHGPHPQPQSQHPELAVDGAQAAGGGKEGAG